MEDDPEDRPVRVTAQRGTYLIGVGLAGSARIGIGDRTGVFFQASTP